MSLKQSYQKRLIEAGCDEAGRGCLAGPVFSAAVILPKDYTNNRLNDSKKLTALQRDKLRTEIMNDAIAWSIASCNNSEIDAMNILRASITAMHRALDGLSVTPRLLLIDGNRFYPYKDVPHVTVIHGDATYLSIAAASILAKTERDMFMKDLDLKYPYYGWRHNKGYPTKEHRNAILEHGISPWHRQTFNLRELQAELRFL